MKIRMILAGLLLLVAAGAQAQTDSMILETTAPVQNGGTYKFQAELYYFNNTNAWASMSAGFSWNENSMVMDSAVIAPAVAASFDAVKIIYRNNNIDTTNKYKNFQASFARIFTTGLTTSGTRKLGVTYYFTITGASAAAAQADSIVLDTMVFSSGTIYKAVTPANVTLFPVFKQRRSFKNPLTVTQNNNGVLPTSFALSQNYPNPFNPTTEIQFDIPNRSKVKLSVFNVLGQQVRTLHNEELAAGSYTVTWDGRSDGGTPLASGVYFYRLDAENFVQTKKMMLIK